MDDSLLSYPTERVVGIAADEETLRSVRQALGDMDVPDERIEVLCSENARSQLQPGTDEGEGALDSAVRVVQKALGDESGRLEHLNAAVGSGAYVVQVELPDADDDTQENAKQSIGHALIDGGATSVAFYGDWQIEELQLGA